MSKRTKSRTSLSAKDIEDLDINEEDSEIVLETAGRNTIAEQRDEENKKFGFIRKRCSPTKDVLMIVQQTPCPSQGDVPCSSSQGAKVDNCNFPSVPNLVNYYTQLDDGVKRDQMTCEGPGSCPRNCNKDAQVIKYECCRAPCIPCTPCVPCRPCVPCTPCVPCPPCPPCPCPPYLCTPRPTGCTFPLNLQITCPSPCPMPLPPGPKTYQICPHQMPPCPPPPCPMPICLPPCPNPCEKRTSATLIFQNASPCPEQVQNQLNVRQGSHLSICGQNRPFNPQPNNFDNRSFSSSSIRGSPNRNSNAYKNSPDFCINCSKMLNVRKCPSPRSKCEMRNSLSDNSSRCSQSPNRSIQYCSAPQIQSPVRYCMCPANLPEKPMKLCKLCNQTVNEEAEETYVCVKCGSTPDNCGNNQEMIVCQKVNNQNQTPMRGNCGPVPDIDSRPSPSPQQVKLFFENICQLAPNRTLFSPEKLECCKYCNTIIEPNEKLIIFGEPWHRQCYRYCQCESLKQPANNNGCQTFQCTACPNPCVASPPQQLQCICYPSPNSGNASQFQGTLVPRCPKPRDKPQLQNSLHQSVSTPDLKELKKFFENPHLCYNRLSKDYDWIESCRCCCKPIPPNDKIVVGGEPWHRECFNNACCPPKPPSESNPCNECITYVSPQSQNGNG